MFLRNIEKLLRLESKNFCDEISNNAQVLLKTLNDKQHSFVFILKKIISHKTNNQVRKYLFSKCNSSIFVKYIYFYVCIPNAILLFMF